MRKLGTSGHRVALLWIILCLTVCLAIVEEDETNYVNKLLRDLDNNNVDQGTGRTRNIDTVKRFWGIPDTSAIVGKIFNYSIPADAFTGNITKFEVTEAGESNLPVWLQFHEATRSFVGVPLVKDMGQYYISVKAVGLHLKSTSEAKTPVAKDVFSVEVMEESSEARRPEIDNVARCRNGESQTLASVIIDATLDDLNVIERTDLLKAIAMFTKLPIKLFKITNKGEGLAFDGNALLAGPGNAKEQLKQGGLIQWHVGCSMTVTSEHKEPINIIEKAAEDGRLADGLGYPVIGWQVTSVFPKISRRDKRQVDAAWGTPVPGVQPTHFPRYTERVDEMEITDDTITPESRMIPTMASPIFTQTSHHHRHHHGESGHERVGHYRPLESPQITMSPTLHHHRIQTAYVTPNGATPVVVPERPTKYVSPTYVDELLPSRYLPEEHTPIDAISSSMTTPVLEYESTEYVSSTFTTSTISIESSSTEVKPTKTQVPDEKTKKPHGTPNFKPTIERRMKKLLMVAGKVWTYSIPRDTFIDMEDGDTRHLKLLFMTSERTAIPQSSWIQFDPEKQMLYALPLEEHIGKYEYILEAMDSEGATTNDRLDIHVWQHSSARARHHEFAVTLKYNKWQYPLNIDWSIQFARKLAKFFGDRNESSIAVQSIDSDPVVFTWTNDSLPTYPCPNEEITQLTRMMVDSNNKVTKIFKKSFGEDFTILSANVKLHGVCHTPGSTTSSAHINTAPKLRNPIEKINTTVGEILRYKVPDDMFFDFEDGNTRYLTLTFLTIESVRPPQSSWVQFDSKSQELYGLAFDGDAGRHEYQIVAMDHDGLQKNDVFVIEVHPRPPKKWNVEFSIHIDYDYEEFASDTSKKVLVAWKLAKLYNDPDPQYISIGSISKGSVVYAWTNNTLPHDPCPKNTIKRLVKNIFNENGTLSSKITNALLPEFKIIKADAMPLGICLGEVTPTSVTVTPTPPPQKAAPAATSDDDIYITTIIPAVVIAVMLIIAAMIACFLYRRKRKGKMTMQGDNTFIGNRAPVIFGDEMEDKPDPAKPPVIMKDEKPPLAPPDYLRSSASSRDSTPQLDRSEQGNTRNTNADLHSGPDPSPPYQPPPPFATNRESKNSRPKTTPTYRQPPPYMPPVPP